MRKSILAGVGLLALSVLPAATAAAQTGTAWLHVRVEEAKEASKVSVNLPMTVVEAVLKASPEIIEKHGKIHLGEEHGLKMADIRKAWKALAEAGDAELVTVESEDENVKVMRKGDLVQVFVDNKAKPGKDGKPAKGGEEVRVEVPVSLVDAFLSGEGEEGNIEAAVAELQKRRGDIVRVQGRRLQRARLDRRAEHPVPGGEVGGHDQAGDHPRRAHRPAGDGGQPRRRGRRRSRGRAGREPDRGAGAARVRPGRRSPWRPRWPRPTRCGSPTRRSSTSASRARSWRRSPRPRTASSCGSRSGDELVVITKEGRSLRVRVSGEKENVSVNVPLHLALQALPDEHGHIRTAALAGALGGVRFTDLVEVQDGNDHVRVWVW